MNGGNVYMDKVYMVLLFFMIVPMLICIKYACKVKSDVASSIVKCLIFAIVTILSNGLFVFSKNESFAYLMEALYLFFLIWCLYTYYNIPSSTHRCLTKLHHFEPGVLSLRI